jgi:hypothetical protein
MGQRIQGNPAELLGSVVSLKFGNPRVSIFMDAQSQKYGKNTGYYVLYLIQPPCPLARAMDFEGIYQLPTPPVNPIFLD